MRTLPAGTDALRREQLDDALRLVGGRHVLFDRQDPPASPVEQMIHHCLSKAEDTTRLWLWPPVLPPCVPECRLACGRCTHCPFSSFFLHQRRKLRLLVGLFCYNSRSRLSQKTCTHESGCRCGRYAEYWWRDEWMSLDAHRDADEVLARTERKLRYPHFGHVLYLAVGKQVRTAASARHERARRTRSRTQARSRTQTHTHTRTHTHEHTHTNTHNRSGGQR